METVISLIIPSFVAGLLTFLAPCTLPLVPGYLAFISGVSARDLSDPQKSKAARKQILINGLMYVIGFSVVFILLGSIFGLAGSFLAQYRIWLYRLGGVFVIFFGFYLMHFFNVPLWRNWFFWLHQEHRFNLANQLTPGKPSSSFIFGATWAFGWTPCIGPILGTILFLATSTGTILQGLVLMLIFSIGLAIPFLVIALGLGQAAKLTRHLYKYLEVISVVGGLFLVYLGYLLLTDNIIQFFGWFYQLFSFVNYDSLLNYL